MVSASTFVGDIAYGVNVLNFVGLEQGTIQMDLDNQPAGDIAQDYSASNRTKHLARRDFRVREAVFSSLLTIRRVPTRDNVADLYTKVFTQQTFHRLRGWALGSIMVAGTSVVAMLVSASRITS